MKKDKEKKKINIKPKIKKYALRNPEAWLPTNSERSPEKAAAMASVFAIDWTLEQACNAAWISMGTYYNRRKTIDWFANWMDNAKQQPAISARKKLMEHINSDDPHVSLKATIEYLKRRDKDYWDKTTTNTVTEVVLSDEERNKIQQVLHANLDIYDVQEAIIVEDSEVDEWDIEQEVN